MARKVLAVLILLCLLSSIVYASDGDSFFSIKTVTITSRGAELNINMEYQLNVFAKVYFWLFGGKAIEPKLLSSLQGFNDLSAEEIKDSGALIISRNSVKEISGYYVFYGGKIDQPVSLIIELPQSAVRRFENTREIPPLIYR